MKPFVLAGLVLIPVLSACGGGRTYDPRLAGLATAPLVAGEGLGDLQLGLTTLGDVVRGYGAGHVSLVAGDEGAIELSYAGGQLDLLFPLPPELYRNEWQALKAATHDLETFVLARPEVAALELASLSVDRRRAEDDPFFKGSLRCGARLGGPIEDVLAGHGAPPGGPGLMVAGMSPDNAPARAFYPALGLLVHYRPSAAVPGAELARAVERQVEKVGVEVDDELSELVSAGTIESIVLFLPGRS